MDSKKMDSIGFIKNTSVIYYLQFHTDKPWDSVKESLDILNTAQDALLYNTDIVCDTISYAHNEARLKWYPEYFEWNR